MAVYTQINLNDVADIVSGYDIGTMVYFESLDGGQANSSYKLETTAGHFVVSVCDEKSFDEVNRLAGVLSHLKNQGFFTTRVVRASDGRLVINFRGKPVVIKEYLEGAVPHAMTPERLSALGGEIARLHRIAIPEGLQDRFPYDLDAFETVIASSADSQYRNWLKDKSVYLKQALRDDLPKALIHGDIFYDNTLYQHDELVAVIDFEEACHYYRVFDLGMCVAGTCGTNGRVDLSKTRHLVDGYQRISPLSPEEKEQLQPFVIYGAVATSFWRFRQYNIILPDSPDAEKYQEMNTIADQVQQVPPDVFYKKVF